jgi:hypothetical protein
MYSVPAREETYRDTERIGTWFKKQEEKRRGGSRF